MTKRIITILIITLIAVCITGCDALRPGLKDLPDTSQNESKDTVTVMAVDTVKRLASQKHIPYSLSDDFIQKYLDMNSFEELKLRTKAGIAATNSSADMTESQYQLWKDIIATEQLNQYTVKNLEDKTVELNLIMDDMAAEANQSIDDFLAKYGMTRDGAEDFVKSQAEKYVQEDTE